MSLRVYKAIVCWMLISWLLAACNSQTVYHQFRYIGENGWRLTDTISFEVPLQDSLHSHLLTLQLRHTAHFPYKNIVIGVQAWSPDSLFTQTQQFSARLMDEQNNWSSSGQGGFYQLDMGKMKLNASLPGNWHVHIFQLMGDSLLPGIHDIGIEVSVLPTGIYTQENK